MIGLGRFGQSVAAELMRRGWDVLGVDADVGVVQKVGEELTQVAAADCTDPAALAQLGVGEFSRVVVGIGTDLEASILTTSALLRFNKPTIWAKAVSAAHGQILEQLGVKHVIRPEQDMGRRVAHLVRGAMLDYVEFEDGFAMVKTRPPKEAVGRPLGDTGIRSKHHVTIVAAKRPGQEWDYTTTSTVLHEGDEIIVAGATSAAERFATLL